MGVVDGCCVGSVVGIVVGCCVGSVVGVADPEEYVIAKPIFAEYECVDEEHLALRPLVLMVRLYVDPAEILMIPNG